jgi:hypothetical protein
MTNFRPLPLIAFLFLFAGRAVAQPAAATPVAPVSDVFATTIAFTWQSSAGATWYQLWLGTINSAHSTTNVIDLWYTAHAVGCTDGGACTITLSPPVKGGTFIWYVRAWNTAGYAAWSAGYNFTVKEPLQGWGGKFPPSRRFSLVLDDQGVLDNETGIIWERTPDVSTATWTSKIMGCMTKTSGGRKGWRLPTAFELFTLIDGGALPPGHPFNLGSDSTFHSQTVDPDDSGRVMIAGMPQGAMNSESKGTSHRAWCVRGSAVPVQ